MYLFYKQIIYLTSSLVVTFFLGFLLSTLKKSNFFFVVRFSGPTHPPLSGPTTKKDFLRLPLSLMFKSTSSSKSTRNNVGFFLRHEQVERKEF